MCIEGKAIWMSNTYLICWHMVEPHRPERVLRQFGLRQHIVPNEGRYHSHARFKSNRRGMAGTNWEMYHRDQIEHWNNRHYHVFHIPDTQELRETEAYMDWYRRITVSYLTQPGMHPQEGYHEAASSYQFLVETVARAYHLMNDSPPADYPTIMSILAEGLRRCGESDKLEFAPSQRSEVPVAPPVQRRPRRQKEKQVRVSQQAYESDEDFQGPVPRRHSSVGGVHISDEQPRRNSVHQTVSRWDPWSNVDTIPVYSRPEDVNLNDWFDTNMDGTGTSAADVNMVRTGTPTADVNMDEEVVEEEDLSNAVVQDTPQPPTTGKGSRTSRFLGGMFRRGK